MSVKYLDFLAKNNIQVYPMMVEYLEKKTGAKPNEKLGSENKSLLGGYGAALDCYEFEITSYRKGKGYFQEQIKIDANNIKVVEIQ